MNKLAETSQHELWLQSCLQGQQAMVDALQCYHLAMDKQVATMAAYRAMGLDPRDVQPFGWGQMQSRVMPPAPAPVAAATVVVSERNVGERGGCNWLRILVVAMLGILGGLAGVFLGLSM